MRVNTSRRLMADHIADARITGRSMPDYSGTGDRACRAPLVLECKGAPDRLLVNLGIEPDRPILADMLVRCRKCEGCLLHRAALWTARAIAECSGALRTWFGTLTLSPLEVFKARVRAAKTGDKRGFVFALLSPDEQFAEIAGAISRDITLFLKRVRKASGATLRYLLVCEAHKSGVPHWHVLLHEISGTVRKRVLDEQWRLGFSQWRLVQGGSSAARYVAKYLAKSAITRVRASARYGGADALLRSMALEAMPAYAEGEAGNNQPVKVGSSPISKPAKARY